MDMNKLEILKKKIAEGWKIVKEVEMLYIMKDSEIIKRYLDVKYEEKEKAKKYGAKFDFNETKKWYVYGNKSTYLKFMFEFTGKTEYERMLESLLKSKSHNTNEDVTVYDKEYNQTIKEEIELLEKSREKYDIKVFDICIICHKKLVPIGDKRTNGKFGLMDWTTRNMHKSCWMNR